MTHSVEESLEEILRRLDSINDSLIVIANYFREKEESEFGDDTR